MKEDAFQSVLLPILRELEGVMDHIVLIGGLSPSGEWPRTVGGPTVGGKEKDGVSDLEVARRYVEVRLGSSGRLLGFPGRTGKEP